ncbi:MAG: DUF2892 domain-containing protein [Bacteroidetes bacterium]|nr:MAG: DUF2892 domain-containing protein [Bacteroidota bacterium]
MKKNMGKVDRTIRLIVAAIILLMYFTGNIAGTLATVLLVVAGIFVITSFINFCPLYRLFGINSCKVV